MSAGLLLGRFQPLHDGHIFVLRQILKECGRAIVVIGSAQASHDADNPFSAGERVEMLRASLTKSELLRTTIIPIEDINRYPLWVAHLESRCPKFDRVYSRNPLTISLFKGANYKVIEHDLYERGNCSGTEIRKRMAQGNPWKDCVPAGARKVIEAIHGEERVRALAGRK
ncbi:MAG: nicotinamide-nucleotide adenylyltransferase [Euryarchaeota archaeon]|nr:nicotinamide-nucleotide adenylyltransferase [Euryarchaeota archaeon]